MSDQLNVRNSANRNILSRVRKVVRDGADITTWGPATEYIQLPRKRGRWAFRMLSCKTVAPLPISITFCVRKVLFAIDFIRSRSLSLCVAAAYRRTSRWPWCARGGTCGWLEPLLYRCVFTLSFWKSTFSRWVCNPPCLVGGEGRRGPLSVQFSSGICSAHILSPKRSLSPDGTENVF